MKQLAQTPAAWTQRVGGLTAVPRLLLEHGASPNEVLASVGLPANALDDAEALLPYATVVRLLVECSKATGCPAFGILAGAQWELEDMGLPGQLARYSDHLGAGLETATVYLRLNNQSATAYFFTSDRYAEVGYAAFHPQAIEMAVVYDLAMASAANQIRAVLEDPYWRPTEVLLPRASPADIEPYRRHFGCPIRYDADRAALRLPLRDLDRPLPAADLEHRERLIDEAERRMGDEFLVRVYESLRMLMLQGSPDSSVAADHLAIHRRTLVRRLARHGTSFREILDQVKFGVARQLLRETTRSVTDIGTALGYSETSAFTCAFRRWSGMSPRAWRDRPREA